MSDLADEQAEKIGPLAPLEEILVKMVKLMGTKQDKKVGFSWEAEEETKTAQKESPIGLRVERS